MLYPKEAVIEQMQHRYQISRRLATSLYDSYEKSNELEILVSLLFDASHLNCQEECVYDV